jgi:hypothetical protein
MLGYGIGGKAHKLRAKVRLRDFIRIILMDDANEYIANTKCKVIFEDGQEILVESDGEGVLSFPRKSPGALDIELLEEEEANTESS